MDGHIYIYGVIESKGQNSLIGVKKQVDAQPKTKKIIVHIRSEGGDVWEGFAIYNYLMSLGIPIVTKIEGICASISTIIQLAGSERTMTVNDELYIHNPWGGTEGESKDFKKQALELEKTENKISKFYSKNTELTQRAAQLLMNEGVSISAEEALKIGFITRIETPIKAVAFYKLPKKNNSKNNFKNKTKMKTELSKKDKSWMMKQMNKLFTSFQNAAHLTLQDASGTDIEFPDVEAGQDPSVGDMALVDGNDAVGDFLMPDGRTFVFVAGELTEIKEAEGDGDGDEEMEALQETNNVLTEEVETLKAELETSKTKMQAASKDFNKFKADLTGKFDLNDKVAGVQNKRKADDSQPERRHLLKD